MNKQTGASITHFITLVIVSKLVNCEEGTLRTLLNH